jgi:hypothetical protein
MEPRKVGIVLILQFERLLEIKGSALKRFLNIWALNKKLSILIILSKVQVIV